MNKLIITALIFCISYGLVDAQSIAEKKAGMVGNIVGRGDLSPDAQTILVQVNKEMNEAHEELKRLYAEAESLFKKNASPEDYKQLLEEINRVRENQTNIERGWRETVAGNGQNDGYALWHQPDTTLGELIIDYGSQHYVYLMSPEVSTIKLSVDSNLPIPRSSWDEMLELILIQNGVGINQLNPFLRQLYLLKQDRSHLQLMTNKRKDLIYLPPHARIAFVLTPEPSEVRRTWLFLDKFVNPQSTVLQMIGRDILIIGQVSDVQELLKLQDFVSTNRGDKEYKAVTLTRVDAEEMAKVLGAIFDQMTDNPKSQEGSSTPRTSRTRIEIKESLKEVSASTGESNGLKIIALKNVAQALFLVGTKEEIRKAEEIIRQVELQVGDAREKIIFWYTTKHSDPEELAQVLYKIYNLIVSTGTGREERSQDNGPMQSPPMQPPPDNFQPIAQRGIYEDGYYLTDNFVVNSDQMDNTLPMRDPPNQNRNNFIVDLKTGAIVMVIEVDVLGKIKELIKKLDVPKKMVQIEVMLFEKRIQKRNDMGLNLLNIGPFASNVNATSALFNANSLLLSDESFLAPDLGVFNFIISRKKRSGIPAYDQSYRFLISQQDVQINASPSLLTVNQVPATIKILDQISVNTGTYSIPEAGTVVNKQSFARAEYGINIKITPSIHMRDEKALFDDSPDYITLDTDIIFDTIQKNIANDIAKQPDVTKRQIVNQVTIPDGQTVVIGGLRRKNTDDKKESVPFLGEIPGFGKFFSNTTLQEESTEMFVFITPKIIADPVEDLERLKYEEMLRRPGDIPEFLCALVAAREVEKNLLFQGTLTMMLGRRPDRCVCAPTTPYSSCRIEVEYDGR